MALILITDDAAFARRMLRRALEAAGHVVIEATNGVECLELIQAHSPECLMLDLLMPELDGYGVLQALQQQSLQLPVIVLSADIQDSARQQCQELGAFAMLQKPPKAQEVNEMIQQALQTA